MIINRKSLSGRFINYLWKKDYIRYYPETLLSHLATTLAWAFIFAIVGLLAIGFFGILGLYVLGSFSSQTYDAIDTMILGFLLLSTIIVFVKLCKLLKLTKVNYK